MAAIRFTPVPNQMGGSFDQVPGFPEDRFFLGLPEAIGDLSRPAWPDKVKVQWEELDGGAWRSTGRWEGELGYTATVTPGDDTVDIAIRLTNESDRQWANSLAFNCYNCGASAALNDYECVRHWARTGGQFQRLTELPRQYGPRPTIQLYSAEGAPAGRDIPFVANFRSTPEDLVLEGWLAIEARDGKRLTAVVSKPTLFLFQNMEYSCIHASPGFGPLGPGETGEALTRIYLVESSLEAWYERMKREMA